MNPIHKKFPWIKDLADKRKQERLTNMTAGEAYKIVTEQEIGIRIPELEPIILKEPQYACFYAASAVQGRWAEAEPLILQDIGWSVWYAMHVIRGQWEEAEEKIKTDPINWRFYQDGLVLLHGVKS